MFLLGPVPSIKRVAAGHRLVVGAGLEGIVSKRLTAPYRSGPSRDWMKVKNPDSAAMIRAREAEWCSIHRVNAMPVRTLLEGMS
jgi:hypothetical protein